MNSYKQFNWLTAFLLSIVTCGIYQIYLWYSISAANNAEAERLGCKKIMGFIPAFLIGMITCGIFLIVWYYLFMNQQVELAQKKGVAVSPVDNAILLTILMFIPIYSYYVLCENYNKVIAA